MDDTLPEDWKNRVRDILHEGKKGSIEMTGQSTIDWLALFHDEFTHNCFDAIEKALKEPVVKCRKIEGMREPGDTYHFLFSYRAKQIYTKISLFPDKKRLKIISAHLARKGDLL